LRRLSSFAANLLPQQSGQGRMAAKKAKSAKAKQKTLSPQMKNQMRTDDFLRPHPVLPS
jgi:hypothetical protein